MFYNFKVIGPNGLLANKTRLLITHGISYLKEVDQIVMLQGKCVATCGIYNY